MVVVRQVVQANNLRGNHRLINVQMWQPMHHVCLMVHQVVERFYEESMESKKVHIETYQKVFVPSVLHVLIHFYVSMVKQQLLVYEHLGVRMENLLWYRYRLDLVHQLEEVKHDRKIHHVHRK